MVKFQGWWTIRLHYIFFIFYESKIHLKMKWRHSAQFSYGVWNIKYDDFLFPSPKLGYRFYAIYKM